MYGLFHQHYYLSFSNSRAFKIWLQDVIRRALGGGKSHEYPHVLRKSLFFNYTEIILSTFISISPFLTSITQIVLLVIFKICLQVYIW